MPTQTLPRTIQYFVKKIIDIKLKDDDDNDDDSGGGDGDDNIECDNLLMPPLEAETPKSFSGSRGAFMK